MQVVKKIARSEALVIYSSFPQTDMHRDSYYYPKTYASHVLALPSKSTRGLATSLGKNLQKLINELNIDRLLFLPDAPTPWQYQQSDYKPVMRALTYLTQQNINKRFNGAIEVPAAALLKFIPHFFWLTRCNAALPDIHFIDHNESILGYICKYGSLHLDILNTTAGSAVYVALAKTSFQYSDITQCGTPIIPARRIIA